MGSGRTEVAGMAAEEPLLVIWKFPGFEGLNQKRGVRPSDPNQRPSAGLDADLKFDLESKSNVAG